MRTVAGFFEREDFGVLQAIPGVEAAATTSPSRTMTAPTIGLDW